MPFTDLFRFFAPSSVRPDMVGEAASAGDIGDTSNSWRYQRSNHGSPAAFARHTDFEQFREHVTALTEELSSHFADSPTAVAGLRQFLSHVTTVDVQGENVFFREHAEQIYAQGAELLSHLVQLSRDPQTDRHQLRAELVDLSRDLALCSAAVIDGLQSSVQRLSAPPRTLSARWHDIQVWLVEQSAAETVRTSDHSTTNRHVVNALLPFLYRKAELRDRPPHDPYAAKNLEKPFIWRAERRLADDLHPASVSMQIAQDYLSRLSASLRESGDVPPETPTLTQQQMEAAIESLAAEFGSRPPPSAAFRADPDGGSCEVATDATLLAVHFLDQWRSDPQTGRRGRRSRPIPIGTPPEGTKLLRAGRLVWAETRGERRLMDVDDLAALKPDDLPAHAAPSIIRSSAPDDLKERLPAEWMSDKPEFEALLDRVDDTAMKVCFERWQASSTPLNRNRQTLLMNALLERGRGAPLFEGAALRWQRLVLPDLEDLESLRMLYRQHQSGEVTTEVLRSRLQASWKAALSGDLETLMRVSMPGSSRQARIGPSAQFAEEWLFAAAEALSSTPPRTTIDEVSAALSAGTRAMRPAKRGEDWLMGIQPPHNAIFRLGTAAAMLDAPQQEQALRPEDARRLLRDVLVLDQGRSRLLQWAWSSTNFVPANFFKCLETAVRSMAQRGCNWSELNALIQMEGNSGRPEMIERLDYARAFIRTRSYPDGPADLDQLPWGFSVIPTARKTFADTGIQTEDIGAQA